jgi:hypothetical protein
VIVFAAAMVPCCCRGAGVPCSELSGMAVDARDLADVAGVRIRCSVMVLKVVSNHVDGGGQRQKRDG